VTEPDLPLPTLLDLYRTMWRIRAFEDAAEEASQGGVAAFGQAAGAQVAVRGPLHLSTGQEAVAAGVCAHLRAGRLPHLHPPRARPHAGQGRRPRRA
jgi:acetoin:2,6-dichlorophenolindophenol oxidoreductase subunit alpha